VNFHDTMRGEFAALSYCWGSASELERNPPYKAVTSNLGELQSGIPISILPRTIREAVVVCSSLKIQYLWVDSLCILQDSEADWQAEALKMETVHSLSKVTIIAASSTSCHSGFLGNSSRRIDLFTAEDAVFQISARNSVGTGFHGNPGFKNDPLEDRGWAYQEEFLSSRYIKFTSDDIQWKCEEGTACLCGHEPDLFHMRQWEPTLSNPGTHQLRRWEQMVESFSRRRFTIETDRLLAFSGVARRLAPQFCMVRQTRYIAGLWETDLVQQLLWKVRSPNRIHCREIDAAPSFSWASLAISPSFDSKVQRSLVFYARAKIPSYTTTTALTEVIDISCQPDFEDNEFGKVKPGAFLALRGPLLRCTLSFTRDTLKGHPEDDIRPFDAHNWPSGVRFVRSTMDCSFEEFMTRDGKRSVKRSTAMLSGYAEEDNVKPEVIEAEVYALMLTYTSQPLIQPLWNQLDGILLAPHYSKKGGYQRIGYIYFAVDPSITAWTSRGYWLQWWEAEVTVF